MISWFSKDIAFLVLYAALGLTALSYLVHRPIIPRWGRFSTGLLAIIYGIVGLLRGNQLLHSMNANIGFGGWGAPETAQLISAASGVEIASLVLQFSFAAVGAGLIVNAVVADKPLK